MKERYIIPTGTRFGKLVVIKECDYIIGKERKYLCKCDCGVEKEIVKSSLTRKSVNSCGCLKSGLRRNNLVGQRMGHLYVHTFLGTIRNGKRQPNSYYKCTCDCGKEIELSLSTLTCGKQKSCGCAKYSDKREVYEEKLIGKKFGKLTVVEFDCIKENGSWWKCLCECGREVSRKGSDILKGKREDCGYCEGKRYTSLRKRTGTPNISKFKGDGIPAKHTVYNGYLTMAKNRSLLFSLSEDDVTNLTLKPCEYCGAVGTNKKIVNLIAPYKYNGIDRVNNNCGYTVDNVVPCCFQHNRMKEDLTQDDFYKEILKVVKYKGLLDKYKEFYDSLPTEYDTKGYPNV